MTLDMHALTLYRLAMKNPDARNTLLSLAAALQRGALRLKNRRPGDPVGVRGNASTGSPASKS